MEFVASTPGIETVRPLKLEFPAFRYGEYVRYLFIFNMKVYVKVKKNLKKFLFKLVFF